MRRIVLAVFAALALAGCGVDEPGGDVPTQVGQVAAGTTETSSIATTATDPRLISYLAELQSSAPTMVDFVDRIEYVDGAVPNMVIVTTYQVGDEDQNVLETLCSVGQLWAVANASGGLIISVAPVDYSTSYLSCTYL